MNGPAGWWHARGAAGIAVMGLSLGLLLGAGESAAQTADECVSATFRDGAVSAEQAFAPHVRGEVERAWPAAWGRGVASLSLSDSGGVEVTVYVAEADAPGRAAVAAILERGLTVSPSATEPLRVLIHDGTEVVFRTVAEFTTCAPRFLDSRRAASDLRAVARRFRVGETTTIRVRLWIGEDGGVGDAMLDQGSGSLDLDAAVLELARNWRYAPARNEGIPVAVWLTYPVTLQYPGGGGVPSPGPGALP